MEIPLESRLQEIIETQVLRQNEQDLPGVLRLIHRESFAYAPSEQMLMQLFASYRLRFSLIEQKFIAVDEKYAYARAKIRTEKLEGPDFRDNITESLMVFRTLDDEWKLWCQSPLMLLTL